MIAATFATPRTLDPLALFDVTTVAVVGASPGKHYSTSVIANLAAFGVEASKLFPINPKYAEIDGYTAYPDLASLPTTADLVVSLVGVDRLESVVDDTIAAGAKAMLVIADGYSEIGAEGDRRQALLREKAESAGLVLLGPNSLGYVSPARKIAAWVGGAVPARLTAGRVALAFQSSGMLNLALNQVAYRKIGLSAAVSVGNEAVMDLGDFIDAFADDPETDVIGVVLESTSRPRRLAEAMIKAHKKGKDLVVLSIGKSELGMKNVASHAGRMATSGAVWDALFRQVGALVVSDLTDFMETIAMLGSNVGQKARGGVALATISGGDCGLLSDLAEAAGMALAPVTDQTQRVLDEQLNRTNILSNPLDVRNTRTSAPQVFDAALTALAADPNVDVVVLRLNLALSPKQLHVALYTHAAKLVRDAGAEVVFVQRVAETASAEWFDLFAELEAPFLTSYDSMIRTFAHIQRHQAALDGLNEGESFPTLPETVGEVADSQPLARDEAMDWLAASGVPFTKVAEAATVDAALAAAGEMTYPLVVKGIVPGVAHKSELGLVEVGIADEQALRESAARIIEKAAAVAGDPATVGIEVQEMVTGGQEFFVGMHTDPILGPVLSFGLGGIFLEVLKDVTYAIPPVSAAQVRAQLQTLKGWPLLEGARGAGVKDAGALSDLIASVSAAIAAPGNTISSFDLNPVLVLDEGRGVCAVDVYAETAK
jgi:acyl-CoA synthetase (NDP forming)